MKLYFWLGGVQLPSNYPYYSITMSAKKILITGDKSTIVKGAMSEAQKVTNAVFFERVFQHLNLNGVWMDDAGHTMTKKKIGDKEYFTVDLDDYKYILATTEYNWCNRRIMLVMDLSHL